MVILSRPALKKAVRLLQFGEKVEHWSLTVADFTHAQNHVMIVIFIGNTHRTGVLANFTLHDFKSGFMSICTVDNVSEHKTAPACGAATTALRR